MNSPEAAGTRPGQAVEAGGGLPREFSVIARHLAPLAGAAALGLADDAAVLAPPPGRELVLTADAMTEGVHFLATDPPDLVARKLLRVNLSDLAAMGATPLGYLLTLTVPPATADAWFAGFAAGLREDQARFAVSLLGGDTVSTPGPIGLTATLIGHVAPGQALRRSGGAPGDGLWVTGTIGDGALGLRALRGELPDPGGTLASRYHLPQPRLGLALHGIVSACMDVSDGLVQDVGHLARLAGGGAVIEAAHVPRSAAAQALGDAWLETCLTGGDDYELLLAVPEANETRLREAAGTLPVTRIGRLTPGRTVEVLDAHGAKLTLGASGWSHL